ncbi:beta-1,4-galactosyltransferase 2-like isoform X2 [Corticium candelabrum]|uniref:beta-1,4-galactosyltransferase 2-like isoform X2 n=1 Tax=Corticium candelabrum TaxID=121492 RepID=UPI002E265DCF|nr:beta-1,4-galactosyltransferase 2-like isoform X2 [Corticium candelabrum]
MNFPSSKMWLGGLTVVCVMVLLLGGVYVRMGPVTTGKRTIHRSRFLRIKGYQQLHSPGGSQNDKGLLSAIATHWKSSSDARNLSVKEQAVSTRNMSKEAQRTTDKERNQGRTVTRDQNLKGREGQSKTTSSQTVRRQKMSLVGQKEEQAVRKENERQTTHTTQKTKLQLTQVNHRPVATKKSVSKLSLCPKKPPDLVGSLFINAYAKVNLDEVKKKNPGVTFGGFYTPPDCQPRDRVAIVIPFRDREEHLKVFQHYMIPVFRRQLIQFKIYVIEQAGNCDFNRGMLLNIGVLEAAKDGDWQCFCLHDVDLILENDRNLYTCPERPKHLSVAVDKFNYRLLYSTLFGGITILTKEQYWKINGYSNKYWGWGGEDDDLYKRVVNNGMTIMRPDAAVARYKMVRGTHHKTSKINPARFSLLSTATHRMKEDGLNSVSYKVTGRKEYQLYTKITVALNGHVNC